MSIFEGYQPEDKSRLDELEQMVRNSPCAWSVAVDAMGKVRVLAPGPLSLINAARLGHAILAACADLTNGSEAPRSSIFRE